MFELSFAKLFVIGVVALIVLGPEKLPAVARMAGTLLGRVQRFLASVKEEVNAQAEDSGLSSLQEDIKNSVAGVRESMHTVLSDVRQNMNEIQDQITFSSEEPSSEIHSEEEVGNSEVRGVDSEDTEVKPEAQTKSGRSWRVFEIIPVDAVQEPKKSESTLSLNEHPPL